MIVSFSLVYSRSIFERLLCARLAASPKETNLGKNNLEPKPTFDAFHVDGPHVKKSLRREEAGGGLSDVPLRCRVTGEWPVGAAPAVNQRSLNRETQVKEGGLSLSRHAGGNNVFELLHIFPHSSCLIGGYLIPCANVIYGGKK